MQMHAKGAHVCWCTWYLGFTDFNEILYILKNIIEGLSGKRG